MKCGDLEDIIRHAAQRRGLHVAITPSATPLSKAIRTARNGNGTGSHRSTEGDTLDEGQGSDLISGVRTLPSAVRGSAPSPFGERPMLVFWETTKACLLACHHCRATAQRDPAPGELSTEDARALLRQIRRFGDPAPVVVFTGGDLLLRRDIYDMLAYARDLGLHLAAAPAATPLLDTGAIARLKAAGVDSISLSLDAPPAVHDEIRGVDGTYARTLEAARAARDLGLRVQINTVVMRRTLDTLPEMVHLLIRERIPVWEVFFLIATGRALAQDALTPKEHDDVCHFLLDVTRYDLLVRTVEAPFVRRVLAERQTAGALGGLIHQRLSSRLASLAGPPEKPVQMGTRGTLDGDGIVFVAHDGTVSPGGFLPLSLGSAPSQDLAAIYRDHPILRAIRAREFAAPCGQCPHRQYCGGSRARAYSACGDPLAADPACPLVLTA